MAECPGGGVLRHALAPVGHLDPAFGGSISDNEVATVWMDFFVRLDATGRPDLEHSLAEAVEVSDDGTEWTFTLREGVQFHDGKPLTAEDIVFTYDRLRDPDLGTATVGLYANITDIEAIDDHTVLFTMENPNPDFLLDLADWHARVVDSEVEDYETEWNGTGPFMVASYSPEDRIVFERNPNYWLQDEAGCALPYVDGVEFLFLSEDAARAEALRSGEIDYLVTVPLAYASPLAADPNIVVGEVRTNSHSAINMRCDEGVFADNRVRQAFKLATDRQAILDAAILGRGSLGNDTPIGPAFGDFHTDELPQERDVEKAKELLAEAGFPDGSEVELYTWNYPSNQSTATVWKEQLAEAGIKVNLNIVPVDVYYGDMWLEEGLTVVEWGGRPYPQAHLALAYTCDAPWSSTHKCDQEIDQLASEAASEMDHETRVGIYHDIQTALMDRGCTIIPFFQNEIAAHRKGVVGIEAAPMVHLYDLARVWLEE